MRILILLSFIISLSIAIESHGNRNDYEYIIKMLHSSPKLRNSFELNTKKFGGKHVESEFTCEPLAPSATVPTSVDKVRPGDIKIVAAMGDSLTAGMGLKAKNILGVLKESRGLSFSIGGDGVFEEHITLPNILKKYNPSITGFSIKSGDVSSPNSRFNVAESGNVFTDLHDEANELVKRISADESIDINNDWKLITILIGDNDLCKFCNEDGHEAERYKAMLRKTLQILQTSLPRTIVSIIEVLNVEIAKELNKGLFCSLAHRLVCGCAAFPKNDQDEEELKKLTKVYQDIVKDIAASGEFDKEDFTVVDQPYFRDTYLPRVAGSDKVDFSYFSPDCFHLSEKGHETAAIALWNNMFQRVGSKSTEWHIGSSLVCPSEESPYIFTNKNSQIKHKEQQQPQREQDKEGTETKVQQKQKLHEPKPRVHVEPKPLVHVEPKPLVQVESKPLVHVEPKSRVHVEPKPLVHVEPKPRVHVEPMPLVH